MRRISALLGFALLTLFAVSAAAGRPTLHTNLEQALNRRLQTQFPTAFAGTPVVALQTTADALRVDLNLAPPFVASTFDAAWSDRLVAAVAGISHDHGMRHIDVRAADAAGAFVPLSDLLPAPATQPSGIPTGLDPVAPDRLGLPPHLDGQPPAWGQGQPTGALSGKTVWLSAGHGWLYTNGQWQTQRGNSNDLVEDFHTAETVNYYLARYLWNAGADVWLVRERGMNTNEVIVDNDGGGYAETGTWNTSLSSGYNGGTYRFADTVAATTATAKWTPNIPEPGWYAVSAWYRHSANRTADARWQVRHAGGTTEVSISQETHGQSWRYLGEYYFDAGTAGSVTLINQSADTGQVVIADAVRFGGGTGTVSFGGGPSDRPRWEESAWPYAEYQGFTAGTNDVTVRPLYAEWEKAKAFGEDAVYISWHTNACCGGSGTESYIHDTEPTAGSAALRDAIHTELISDIRNGWDAGWVDRGQKSANFGELRELSTMPGVLLEIAFHDNPDDANDIKSPGFRLLTARAVYQGIAEYYGGSNVPLLPEPPTHLRARQTAPGTLTLAWRAPSFGGVVGDAATGYRVYYSPNGRGFDDGVPVNGTSITIDNLPPNRTLYFRVSATNAGGESFPTAVVAARLGGGASNNTLIVDGFDRLDRFAVIPEFASSALGTIDRGYLERMNRFDYAVEHATALASCGYAFDGATNEAVASGDVPLGGYTLVDWFTGEESTADESLSATERSRLATYLNGGGNLFISGAEIGWHLARPNGGADPAFYNQYLKATYQGDDAATYTFTSSVGSLFGRPLPAALTGTFDDSTQGFYDVNYPDRLGATGGSSVALTYVGGTGDGAAVLYAGSDYRLVNVGFPVETITDAAKRNTVICYGANFLTAGVTD